MKLYYREIYNNKTDILCIKIMDFSNKFSGFIKYIQAIYIYFHFHSQKYLIHSLYQKFAVNVYRIFKVKNVLRGTVRP